MNIELKVININNNLITVKDTNNKEIILNMQVYDIKLDINDIIILNNKLLDEIKNNFTSFGLINDIHGRNLKEIEKNELVTEFIIIYKNKETIYLKRLYG